MYLSVTGTVVLLLAGALPASAGELETSYQQLRDAVSKKDAAEVKQLASATWAEAQLVLETKPPEEKSDRDTWNARLTYAREIQEYAEFALYSTAIGSPAATQVDLFSALEQQNPKSKYLGNGYGPYVAALAQTGATARIPAIAEKAIANFPEDEDLLLILADTAMTRRQVDRAGNYAERVITVMGKHPKPEGMTAADWDRKKAQFLGRSYWIAGLVHSERRQYYQADKDLRAALPYIKENNAMLGPALFNLGVASYQLGREGMNRIQILDGARFSEQAAAIAGPHQQQAWTNAHLMRAEAEKLLRK